MRIYLVGGAVRDELLGLETKDKDYVVVGATEDEFLEQFPEAEKVGESFPVFLHKGDEYALARTEKKSGSGYKGFEVDFGPDVSLEEDLERRDLTINAIAKDPKSGELIDPFDGQEDLEEGRLRHVSEAFKEDPLRVLRTARFAARYPWMIVDWETIQLCRKVAPELENVANERIWEEVRKCLENSRKPRRFFDYLLQMEALEHFLPEFERLTQIPAGPAVYHGEGTAYEHSMICLEKMKELSDDRLSLICALFHDIGKVRTPKDQLPHHYDHEKLGMDIVEDIAERLRWSRKELRFTKQASKYHGKVAYLGKMKASKVIRMVDKIADQGGMGLGRFFDLIVADRASRHPPTARTYKDTPEWKRDKGWMLEAKSVIENITASSEDLPEDKHTGEKLLQARLRELRSRGYPA